MELLVGAVFSLFFGIVPMFFFAWLVYWTDRFEKEPKFLLFGAFNWGVFVAASGSFILNTILGIGVYFLTESESTTSLATGSLIAPFIEETFKGAAVLIIFLLFRHEFDSILDGIVYAAITAIGFAATENAYYIFNGYIESGLGGGLFSVFVRVILVGWQHPFYTAFIGIGLAVARLNRSRIIGLIAPILGWSTAVFTHALHNTLAQLISDTDGMVLGIIVDWSGWLLMLFFIIWAVYRESRWIVKYLVEEVDLGIISLQQYKTACSTWSQSSARLSALLSGKYRLTRHFYQTCAELAFKKYQLATLGEESGNSSRVRLLRGELSQLAQQTAQ